MLTKPQKKQPNSRTWNKSILRSLMEWLGRSRNPDSSIKDKDPQHHLVSQTYRGYNRKKADSKVEGRKDGALLAQLRAGHCLELSHYKNRIDPSKSATCPRCNEEEETVAHWIRCPATIRTREEIFGKSDVNLDVISTNPTETLAFAKETFQRNP